jgi:hypothetical protein
MAFDLLHLDGRDLTGLPLVERKRLLDDLHLVGPAWVVNGWHPGEGDMLFQVCPELGNEGVVATRLDAPLPTRYSVPKLAQEKMPCLEEGSRPATATTGIEGCAR